MPNPLWISFVQRAAAEVGAAAAAPDDGPTLSVVFHGSLRGSVHASVRPGDATAERAAQFARALRREAEAAGFSFSPLWHGRTLGPHEGERAGPLVVDISSQEELKRIHMDQSIAAAQQVAERSVIAIGTEMRGIWDLARAQASGLEQVAAQFAAGGETVHANVATTIDQLAAQMRAFGAEILDRTHRQAADIEQARGWTNEIVKLGVAISAIASNARLLTFNARLESARIGEAGRGFAVIAGAIQDLALQVRQANSSVGRLAQNLAGALPRVAGEASHTATSAQTSVRQLEAQLLDVQGLIATMRTASWDALSKSSQAALELQRRADTAVEHLQFQDRTNQMLNEARQQAGAILTAVGLDEFRVADHELEQVGVLGRSVESDEPVQAPGAVMVF